MTNTKPITSIRAYAPRQPGVYAQRATTIIANSAKGAATVVPTGGSITRARAGLYPYLRSQGYALRTNGTDPTLPPGHFYAWCVALSGGS